MKCRIGCGHDAEEGSRYCAWCDRVLNGKPVAERQFVPSVPYLQTLSRVVKAEAKPRRKRWRLV